MPIARPAANAATYLDEDTEDMAPKVGTTVQSGWENSDVMTSKNSDFPSDLKFTDEPTLIKFLDGPYFYQQHWIERPKGRKSFTCIGESCPLCNVLGDEPRSKAAFNVLVMSGGDEGLRVLNAVPTLFRLIKKAHEDDRKGPINREYWAVSRAGTGKETLYSLDYVRSRDLDEEWGINPDDAKDLVAAAEPWPVDKIVRQESASELLEVARSLVN